jgi:hypothetical protein
MAVWMPVFVVFVGRQEWGLTNLAPFPNKAETLAIS